jgi:hypothetical protein
MEISGCWSSAIGEEWTVRKTKAHALRPPGRREGASAAVRLVIAQERQVWKAAQERNAEEFSKLVPADAVMIFQSGIVRQPEYLATMKARVVTHSGISKMQGFMPNASTVILIYQTARKGSYAGREFPSTPVIESTTWIKRGGRWVAILNQETPVSR